MTLKHTSLAPILLTLIQWDVYNVKYLSRSLILISEDSPGVLCPSRPYSRLGSLSGALDYPSGQPPNRSPSPAIPNPLKNSTLQMSLPPDTPQGIADTLGYLQHHLQELTER